MKRQFLFVMLIVGLIFSGYNTFYGVGRDIEQGGEAIQDAASQ